MALVKVVPPAQRRILHYACKGRDVLAYQRLLARALRKLGMVPINHQNGTYGKGTTLDTLRLQRASGIVANGRVGALTWTAVDPQMRAYERVLLALPKPKPLPLGAVLAHQMHVMLAIGMRRYSQRRRSAVTLDAWQEEDDCSGSVSLARAIVVRDHAYAGDWNTSRIWSTYPHVAEHEVRLGDGILYGRNGVTDHINVVTDVRRRRCIGFGFAPGGEYPWTAHHSPIMGFVRMA